MKLEMLLAVVGLCACGCGGGDSGPPDTGTLVVDFTIAGSKDPAGCSDNGAASIDVTVQTPSGAVFGEFQEACEDFSTSIPLPPGPYTASVLLLDAHGADATSTLDLDSFVIDSDTQLVVPIDFPQSSFL